jgi:hypothetical protein
VCKTQRGIACDTPLPVDDLRDPIGWDMELTSELSRQHADRFQLLGQNLAGVMNLCGH